MTHSHVALDVEIGEAVDAFGGASGEQNAPRFEVYGLRGACPETGLRRSAEFEGSDPMSFRDERWARENFTERYRISDSEVLASIEREVIGGVWGANGYTTRAQADELASLLDLAPGRRLLDLGAGRGWPGLYLSARTGCDVVLADLPHNALRIAASTARRRGLDERAHGVVVSARDLPLRRNSFDAIVHTDVLC